MILNKEREKRKMSRRGRNNMLRGKKNNNLKTNKGKNKETRLSTISYISITNRNRYKVIQVQNPIYIILTRKRILKSLMRLLVLPALLRKLALRKLMISARSFFRQVMLEACFLMKRILKLPKLL